MAFGQHVTIDLALQSALRQSQLHVWEGSHCAVTGPVWFEPPFAPMRGIRAIGPCDFGAFSYSYSPLTGVARVGRYCSFADEIQFGPVEHPTDWISTSSFTYDATFIWKTFRELTASSFEPLERHSERPPIIIGNDVWIGTGAYVRAGVSIGDGAIVGARSVVTKDIPPYTVVAGNPARPLKLRFPEHLVEAVRESQWWKYAYTDFSGLPLSDPAAFVERLTERAVEGSITPYAPPKTDLATLLSHLNENRSG